MILHNLPIDEYHARGEASNSQLGRILRAPALLGVEEGEKAGQLEGNLAHCATLEPTEFNSRYAIGPDAARNTKEWKEWAAEIRPELTPIKPGQATAAWAQARSVRSIPDVAAILARGEAEVSAIADDGITGIACRCRPDWVHPVDDKRVILLDLKTYSDASPREFARQVARKGYARQAAFYTDLYASAADVEVIGFVFVAVETAPPYLSSACMLDEDSIEQGRRDYRRALDILQECRRTGVYPGYGDEVQLIRLPAWAFDQEELDL